MRSIAPRRGGITSLRVLFLALLLTTTTAARVAGQSDSTVLPPVVVTATRLASPIASHVAATTVLDAAALRHQGVRTVAEALRLAVGSAVVRSGSPGAVTSLFLRGGESDFTRLVIDGVAVNDPGGSVDLALFSLDGIDRIEIVRGPASVLYGADAMTGVVQLHTARPAAARALSLSAGAGSYNSHSAAFTAGLRAPHASATVGAATHASDGVYDFNNRYTSRLWNARADWLAPQRLDIAVHGRVMSDDFHYPTDGAGNATDRNAMRTNRRSAVSVEASRVLGASRLRLTIGAMDGRGRTDDAPDGPADTLGFTTYRSSVRTRRRSVDAQWQLTASPSDVGTLGVEWSGEALRSRDSSSYDVAPNAFAADRRTTAAYAQWAGRRGRWQYVAGGRLDRNTVFGDFGTARAGLSLDLTPRLALRATLGNAFKAPTFLEQFNSAFSIGNPTLAPERTRSLDAGLAFTSRDGRWSAGASWFAQRFRDLIDYVYRDEHSPNYYNVAGASSRGVELEAAGRLTDRFRVAAGSTLLRTRVTASGFDSSSGAALVSGQRLLRRPVHTSHVTLSLNAWHGVAVDGTMLMVGPRDDRDYRTFPATPLVLPRYTRVDGALHIPLGSGARTQLLLRAENLLGARYAEVAFFPAPGRVLSVSLLASTLP